MRKWKVGLVCIAAFVLLMVGFCRIVPHILLGEIRRKEGTLRSAPVAHAVGPELALLSQTCKAHPEWFANEPAFAPAWTPASVLRLEPTWVDVGPDGARVEFGGGFYHFGYLLKRESQATETDRTAAWVLYLYSEDSKDRALDRFTFGADEALTEEQFVDRTLAELDRRIASGDDAHVAGADDAFASVQRCKFAIKHHQVERLRRAIRDTARQNADAWRDVLLAYLIDSRSDPPGAAERLRQWAASKGDFSAWLLGAYAFDKAGEPDAAEEAVLRACTFPADDPPWLSYNARYRGLALCYRLYAAGKRGACEALCGSLLAYSGSQDYLANDFLLIQKTCRSEKTSTAPAWVPTFQSGFVFDPFAGIDIDALRTADLEER
jgi:hypothetical protein